MFSADLVFPVFDILPNEKMPNGASGEMIDDHLWELPTFFQNFILCDKKYFK
jgi:hypothetical protein